ncbi:hypothetical protein [Parafrankia sp. EUN1f]|uniref:hypothetical protein n=1 Tax=Parafrankia sp. EUN1f TaxID=102897 RepID=UPI0001C46D30|nr:hypothetical protein [Parafrankia sp. EUN1f]EFC80049.1 secreted protein [Parafrankia sp. EUN1f]
MSRKRVALGWALTGITGALVLAVGPVVTPVIGASAASATTTPDFGPNVTIFDPTTPVDVINSTLQSYSTEAEFSANRRAVFFMPGTYGSAAGANNPSTATGIVNSEVGYYTSIQGLGSSPNDVVINGALHVEPVQGNPYGNPTDGTLYSNSLTQFWRSMSNLSINPIQRPVGADATRVYPEGIEDPHTLRWAVSQAAPLRRVNVLGNLDLTGRYGAYAFGTYVANSKVSGQVVSGDGFVEKAQAHWYTRDSQIGSWDGRAVNIVYSGVTGAPVTDFSPGDKTNLATTPVSRDAPFLYVNGGQFRVFVPAAKQDTAGVNWSTSTANGRQLAIDTFYIAKPSDTAATINARLQSGKNLILTPGVYNLDAPLQVTRKDTVVMGLGYATLAPMTGRAALEIGNVDGVVVSGLTVDAGAVNSNVLVQVGKPGSSVGDPRNPTTLSDVFVRVGGPHAGKATTSVEVNNNYVILDHSWLWRADHGTGVGWAANVADHGLVVNGDGVTALGLFVEHYQKNQVVWNGDRGTTIFYQSEMPYDPPSQAAYMNGSKEGYASYLVSPGVTDHDAIGLAVYTFFQAGANVHVSSAIEAPTSRRVAFESMTSTVILGDGGIRHVINSTGAAVDAASPGSQVAGLTAMTRLTAFPTA